MKRWFEGPNAPALGGAIGRSTRLGERKRPESLHDVVSIDLEGVPLQTSLRLLLKQLDLAYCVKDGVLIISSVRGDLPGIDGGQ